MVMKSLAWGLMLVAALGDIANNTEVQVGALQVHVPANCSLHLGCAGLAGDCCPTMGGMMLTCCNQEGPIANSVGMYINNYNGSNPLSIKPDPRRSNNYFLIIGDWGKADGPGHCQSAVAQLMQAYVQKQSAQGKKLLFIAAVGDNFYWSGVRPTMWQNSWVQPYGTNTPGAPLYKVPWLAVLGNHDYGNDDPYAFCPYAQAQAMASFDGQLYGSGQMNADKNPTRPSDTEHYWLPDYNYHYEIPEADLEVIAIDTNSNGLGDLGGDWRGHGTAFNGCGGAGEVENFLTAVDRSGTQLLRERAQKGTARTVLIIQHFPGACQRDVFESSLRQGRQVDIICAYGHVHAQECHRYNGRGQCDTILSGGGGGCCAPQIFRAGFAAVHLDDDGSFHSDVQSSEVTMSSGSCWWGRRLQDFV